MATFNQGILGGFSGKVGTVIGSTWKSINYMRALAVNVHNPNTVKQQCQRGRFRTAAFFCKAVKPVIQNGFREYASRQTAVNAAMSYLLRNAVVGCAKEAALDFDKVRVSQGSLTAVVDATVEVEGSKAAFSWTDNSGMGDATGEDVAMVLAYNKDRQEAVYDLTAAKRADGAAELTLPAGWDGEALAVYLGFCSEDGRHASNSICLKNDGAGTGGVTPEGPDGGESGEDDEGPQLG